MIYSTQAYEFEIQPYEEGNRGDTSRWTPVIRSSATDAENEGNGTLGLSSPLVTATGLSPSTSYRFRVSGRHARGITMVSGISEVFTTGKGFFVLGYCRFSFAQETFIRIL